MYPDLHTEIKSFGRAGAWSIYKRLFLINEQQHFLLVPGRYKRRYGFKNRDDVRFQSFIRQQKGEPEITAFPLLAFYHDFPALFLDEFPAKYQAKTSAFLVGSAPGAILLTE